MFIIQYGIKREVWKKEAEPERERERREIYTNKDHERKEETDYHIHSKIDLLVQYCSRKDCSPQN